MAQGFGLPDQGNELKNAHETEYAGDDGQGQSVGSEFFSVGSYPFVVAVFFVHLLTLFKIGALGWRLVGGLVNNRWRWSTALFGFLAVCFALFWLRPLWLWLLGI